MLILPIKFLWPAFLLYAVIAYVGWRGLRSARVSGRPARAAGFTAMLIAATLMVLRMLWDGFQERRPDALDGLIYFMAPAYLFAISGVAYLIGLTIGRMLSQRRPRR